MTIIVANREIDVGEDQVAQHHQQGSQSQQRIRRHENALPKCDKQGQKKHKDKKVKQRIEACGKNFQRISQLCNGRYDGIENHENAQNGPSSSDGQPVRSLE